MFTGADAAALQADLFDTTVTVYGEGASGQWDTVLRTGLAAHFALVTRQSARTAQDRAELSAIRELYWHPDYVMPEYCQIAHDGIRWQPQPGTFAVLGTGTAAARRCDITRSR